MIFDKITIENIAAIVIFLVGLITGIKYLHSSLKSYLTILLDDKFDKLDEKIDKLESKIDIVELASSKNYIVPYLADIDRGGIPDEIERQRFWDAYEVYIKDGGNSYIQDRVKQLQKEGRL